MPWSIAQARQRLSEVVRLAAEEPQPIYNRGRLVGAFIDANSYQAFEQWRREASRTTIAVQFDRLRAELAAAAATQSALTLSVVTVEEIAFGLSWRPNPVLLGWFERLLAQYAVLPVDADVARHAGMMRGTFAARGVARTQADMLIAAIAHAHRLVLVTRNVRDFEGCGVTLLNPFSEP